MAMITREEANSGVAELRQDQERREIERKLMEELGLEMARKRVLECRAGLRLAMRDMECRVGVVMGEEQV